MLWIITGYYKRVKTKYEEKAENKKKKQIDHYTDKTSASYLISSMTI
jgi:hypothetical protein